MAPVMYQYHAIIEPFTRIGLFDRLRSGSALGRHGNHVQGLPELFGEAFRCEWLVDEDGAVAESAFSQGGILGVSRHEGNGGVRIARAYRGRQLAAAHVRHDHVREYEVDSRLALFAERNGFRPAPGLENFVAGTVEHSACRRAHLRVILDEEHEFRSTPNRVTWH